MKVNAASFAIVATLVASTVAKSGTTHAGMNRIEARDDGYGGSPPSKPVEQCSYSCDADGNWKLTSATVNDCPDQVVAPDGKSAGDTHGCNVKSTPSLIGVSALNCAHVCVLTSNCHKVQDCQVTSQGSIINVSALNCADVNILST